MNDRQLAETIQVTAEVVGTPFSAQALAVIVRELSAYPQKQVAGALTRCRRECRGKLTLADILARLDDGRPGVEEAWARLPRGEDASLFWTDEMRKAWSAALPILDDDPVAARMAFKESYQKLVSRARDANEPVRWSFSPGRDPIGRGQAVREALEAGIITRESHPLAMAHLTDSMDDEVLQLAGEAVKRLT